MSLINDALKKAQTDVVRGGPPNPMAGSLAGAHVQQQKQSPLLKIAFLVLFFGASVWAVSLFLGSSDEPAAVVEAAAATPTAAVEAAPEIESLPAATSVTVAPETPVVTEEPEVSTTPETNPAVVASGQAETSASVVSTSVPPAAASLSSPAPASVVTPEPTAPAVAESSPAQTAPTVPPATEPIEAAPKPSTSQEVKDEIIYTLKQLEITAVMGEGNKARIMSGGQIHRAGELIHLDLKIRFQGKKGKTLYFTDPAGEIYEKAL